MSTLLLRYATPLVAFGDHGRFANRPTAPTPTVSAVQGLIAAAAGIGRIDTYPDWITLVDLAVRVERYGRTVRDFQTINPPNLRRRYRRLSDKDLDRVRVVAQVDGGRRDAPVISERWYVTDAEYLFAVADPTGNVMEVLTRPRWALYAGRKSCPLTEPFLLGDTDAVPAKAVQETPAPAQLGEDEGAQLRQRQVIVFAEPADAVATRRETRNDRLIGFKRQVPQSRYHLTVHVPAVAMAAAAGGWFDVIETLRPRSAV